MSDCEREMTLEEWCNKLPKFHLVNKQLKELKDTLTTQTEPVAKLQCSDGFCCPVMDDCEQLKWLAGDKERLASALREIYNIRGEDEEIAKIVNEALDQGCAT